MPFLSQNRKVFVPELEHDASRQKFLKKAVRFINLAGVVANDL